MDCTGSLLSSVEENRLKDVTYDKRLVQSINKTLQDDIETCKKMLEELRVHLVGPLDLAPDAGACPRNGDHGVEINGWESFSPVQRPRDHRKLVLCSAAPQPSLSPSAGTCQLPSSDADTARTTQRTGRAGRGGQAGTSRLLGTEGTDLSIHKTAKDMLDKLDTAFGRARKHANLLSQEATRAVSESSDRVAAGVSAMRVWRQELLRWEQANAMQSRKCLCSQCAHGAVASTSPPACRMVDVPRRGRTWAGEGVEALVHLSGTEQEGTEGSGLSAGKDECINDGFPLRHPPSVQQRACLASLIATVSGVRPWPLLPPGQHMYTTLPGQLHGGLRVWTAGTWRDRGRGGSGQSQNSSTAK